MSGIRSIRTRSLPMIGAVVALQAVLVGAAVAPQLSARVSGQEIRLEVGVVDPIDPFRGAYVDLGYPGLVQQPNGMNPADPNPDAPATEERGAAYVPLVKEGDLWVGKSVERTRPDGLYLACDDSSWRLRCGIESWFLPQGKASSLDASLRERKAVATVKVDGRGNAALVSIAAR
jgi:uncharacterized membrane-anchored protein